MFWLAAIVSCSLALLALSLFFTPPFGCSCSFSMSFAFPFKVLALRCKIRQVHPLSSKNYVPKVKKILADYGALRRDSRRLCSFNSNSFSSVFRSFRKFSQRNRAFSFSRGFSSFYAECRDFQEKRRRTLPSLPFSFEYAILVSFFTLYQGLVIRYAVSVWKWLGSGTPQDDINK
jgi:hypothetical protein